MKLAKAWAAEKKDAWRTFKVKAWLINIGNKGVVNIPMYIFLPYAKYLDSYPSEAEHKAKQFMELKKKKEEHKNTTSVSFS